MSSRISIGNANVQTWLSTFHGGFVPAATSQTFTVGRVLLMEFVVEKNCRVDQIVYVSGGTAAGSATVGIYGPISTRETPDGAALLVESSSTAQSGTNTPQPISITETTLVPGLYYVALEGSDATGTYMRNTNQTQVTGFGAYYDRGGGYGALTNPCPATTATGSALPGIKLRIVAS